MGKVAKKIGQAGKNLSEEAFSDIMSVLDEKDEAGLSAQVIKEIEQERKESGSDYYERQLEEANQKFLDLSEKFHKLENESKELESLRTENSRLIAENQQLKSKCSELEEQISNLENQVFLANIEISSKNSKIIEIQSNANRQQQNNPNGYNIPMSGPKGIKGMNGYESWN